MRCTIQPRQNEPARAHIEPPRSHTANASVPQKPLYNTAATRVSSTRAASRNMQTHRWRGKTLKAVLAGRLAPRGEEQERSKMFAHAAPVTALAEADAAALALVGVARSGNGGRDFLPLPASQTRSNRGWGGIVSSPRLPDAELQSLPHGACTAQGCNSEAGNGCEF